MLIAQKKTYLDEKKGARAGCALPLYPPLVCACVCVCVCVYVYI